MDIAWQVEGALYKKGGMDLYGEAKYEFAAQIKMGVVSFVDSIDKTSVRADSSASRGKAEIALFDAVFIVPLSAPIAKEDVLIVNGKKMRVESIHQRWGLRGCPGHYEVGANIWV
ncbi:hypothetical protein [Klebsiella quasipneumoniae]|jgi:hypothetical protein|uniref:hypothetical protein n=1 Tax=Klebsiella quasipneumoniae TaxID=1463165 RepID=UPI0021DA80FA|nr:hypothetical protein [Klebsiella quasipneumoniae]MCU8815585.1 hypothetical protein [Klebsiella quasipneumoniae]